MRAKDVAQLVAAWSNILDGVEKTSLTTEIGELCFEVIGQYVEWIDINLVSFYLFGCSKTLVRSSMRALWRRYLLY